MKFKPFYILFCSFMFASLACTILQPLPTNAEIPTKEVVLSDNEGEVKVSYPEIASENINRLSEVLTIKTDWLVYSPDYTLIAGPFMGFISILDARNFEEINRLQIEAADTSGERTLDLKFSPDGSVLATANSDGVTRLWSIHDGKLIQTLSGCSDLTVADSLTIDYLHDGAALISSCIDGTINLWDTKTGDVLNSFEIYNTDDASVTLINSGQILAIASGNQFDIQSNLPPPNTLLYQTETGAPIATLEGFLYDVSPDERYISTIQGNLVRVYTASGDILHQTEYIFEQFSVPLNVYSADFSADSTVLIIPTDDGTTHVLDSRDGKILYKIDPTEKVRFIGDEVFIVESGPGEMTIRKINDDSVINTFVLDNETVNKIGDSWIVSLYDKERSVLALISRNVATDAYSVVLVNSSTGDLLVSIELLNEIDPVFSEIYFSPDGRFLFFSNGLGKIIVFGIQE